MNPNDFIEQYGYWGIAFVLFFEMIGIPFPSETTLILAGIAWGGHRIEAFPLLLTALLAHLSGSMLAYGLGRFAGRRLLERYGPYIGLTSLRLVQAETKFRQFQGGVIFFGKFLAFIRILIPYIAGFNKVPFLRFSVINLVSTLIWIGLFTISGYYLGDLFFRYEAQVIHWAGEWMSKFGWPIAGISLLLFAWWLLHRKKKANA